MALVSDSGKPLLECRSQFRYSQQTFENKYSTLSTTLIQFGMTPWSLNATESINLKRLLTKVNILIAICDRRVNE